jgi:hypothetical protein
MNSHATLLDQATKISPFSLIFKVLPKHFKLYNNGI